MMETPTEGPRPPLTAEEEALGELTARQNVSLNKATARRVIDNARRRSLRRDRAIQGIRNQKRARSARAIREDVGAAFAEVCGK